MKGANTLCRQLQSYTLTHPNFCNFTLNFVF